MGRSDREMEKWTRIVNTQGAKGVERLRGYVCSLVLGREFNEKPDAYFARKDLTRFVDWAHRHLRPDLFRSVEEQRKISITPGMAHVMGRSGVARRCTNKDCGMEVPRYRGRYPGKCSHCGADLEVPDIDEQIRLVVSGVPVEEVTAMTEPLIEDMASDLGAVKRGIKAVTGIGKDIKGARKELYQKTKQDIEKKKKDAEERLKAAAAKGQDLRKQMSRAAGDKKSMDGLQKKVDANKRGLEKIKKTLADLRGRETKHSAASKTQHAAAQKARGKQRDQVQKKADPAATKAEYERQVAAFATKKKAAASAHDKEQKAETPEAKHQAALQAVKADIDLVNTQFAQAKNQRSAVGDNADKGKKLDDRMRRLQTRLDALKVKQAKLAKAGPQKEKPKSEAVSRFRAVLREQRERSGGLA